MIEPPKEVKQTEISDRSITKFNSGLITLSTVKSPDDAISQGVNLELTPDGMWTPRPSLSDHLPKASDNIQGQVIPVNRPERVYYFAMIGGKVNYTSVGDTSWTPINSQYNNYSKTATVTFLQTDDKILIMNGVNELSYVDLSEIGFPISVFDEVADPTVALTATNTGLAGDKFTIYYGYSYNGVVGETAISPILSYKILKPRDTWEPDKNSITLKLPNNPPNGAKSYNIYIALAAQGVAPQWNDMLRLATNLDLNNKEFVDNGTLVIDISRGNPPLQNSTKGPKTRQGIEANGRPILYDDPEDPWSVYIGGDGEHPLDFSTSFGGFRSVVGKGTAFHPQKIIYFRSGQGIPELKILSSSVYGIGKTYKLAPKTITYGNASFIVWAVEEEKVGSGGTTAPHSVMTYSDNMYYWSPDGIEKTGTQAEVQNILSTNKISNKISPSFRAVLKSQHSQVVGAAWSDKLYWAVPANGSKTNNQIWIHDLLNGGSWYFHNIKADWLFVVAEKNGQTYVCVVDGASVYKFSNKNVAMDTIDGKNNRFITSAIGSSLAFNDQRNRYFYVIQAVFTLLEPRGKIKVGVSYANESNQLKNITREMDFSEEAGFSSESGWSNPELQWDNIRGWSEPDETLQNNDPVGNNLQEHRFKLDIEDIVRSAQWTISSSTADADFQLSSITYQGKDLGTKIDLQR